MKKALKPTLLPNRSFRSDSATILVYDLLTQGILPSSIPEKGGLTRFTVSKAISQLVALKCVKKTHKIGRTWEVIPIRRPSIVATSKASTASMLRHQTVDLKKGNNIRYHGPHHLSGFFRVISGEPAFQLPVLKSWQIRGVLHMRYLVKQCFCTFIFGKTRSSLRIDVPAELVTGISVEEQRLSVLSRMEAAALEWSSKTAVAVEVQPYRTTYEWVNLSYPISKLFIDKANLRNKSLGVVTPEGPATIGTDSSHLGLLETTLDGSTFAAKQAELLFEGKLAPTENVLSLGTGLQQQINDLKKGIDELAQFVVNKK